MMAVWKYKMVFDDFESITKLRLPRDAKILSVAVVSDEFFVWVLVNTEHQDELETRKVWIRGTGHTLPGELLVPRFIGTVHVREYVFHFFEETK